MKQQILLTGASGSIGNETLKELLKQTDKFEISVFDVNTKKTNKLFNTFKDKINIFYGDISKYEDIEKCTKNIDFVIHLAALIPPYADKYPKLAEKVNVLGTENLVKALKKNSPNVFILYSSSISIYGDRIENPMIKVDDILKPSIGDEYAKTKIKAESIIKNSGLNWTIFRFGAIMSPTNAKADPLLFHMPLNTSLEIATTRDTAFALVNSIFKTKQLEKQIFNLAGGEKCRIIFDKFITKSFNLMGFRNFTFPKHAFAEQNFHCGFYQDGHLLNNILNFQRDSIETYFEIFGNSISKIKKITITILNKIILYFLIKKSEPLNAIKKNDTVLIKRFFKKLT